jgi:hypothetical protein
VSSADVWEVQVSNQPPEPASYLDSEAMRGARARVKGNPEMCDITLSAPDPLREFPWEASAKLEKVLRADKMVEDGR